MAIQVHCPACRAAVMVYNARYLVFLKCHACGHEFMADEEDLAAGREVASTVPFYEAWPDENQAEAYDEWGYPAEVQDVLMFCPMCGEMAPESALTCSACGEPLPADLPGTANGWNPNAKQARRFRRQARLLGLLWLILAYFISAQDIWLSETEFILPKVLSGGRMGIPPIPLVTSLLVCLGAFSMVGQFWSVAVGGGLNYLLLFIVVWKPNVISVALIGAAIFLTHSALHTAASSRDR